MFTDANAGKIAQFGPREQVYLQPKKRSVAQFLGEANVLPTSNGNITGFGRASSNAEGYAILRPEHIAIEPSGQSPRAGFAAEATITSLTFQGLADTSRGPARRRPLRRSGVIARGPSPSRWVAG